MNEELLSFAVDKSREMECEYSEARFHTTKSVVCSLRNGAAEPAAIMNAAGIGLRVLYDGILAFGATNIISKESLSTLLQTLVKNAKAASPLRKKKSEFSQERTHVEKWRTEEKKNLENMSIEDMLSVLKDVDQIFRDSISGVEFPKRQLNCGYNIEEKSFQNSEGSKIQARITRAWYSGILVSMYDGKPKVISSPSGGSRIGGTGGAEILQDSNLVGQVSAEINEIAPCLKATSKAPSNELLDVILGPSVAGLTSHESCGHPGEADRILGREAAQAGESFLKPQGLGMMIGSEEAFVSDDPTIPHSMGFYLFDDEGVKARKRRLIEAGRFTEFLHNRETAVQFGTSSNASARAVSFDREPIIRMANTFIEPGDWTFDEMIKETRKGVYIKNFMEWNIDDKRLNQRYVGLEAYLIQNGKLENATVDPVLEITTPKYWQSMDARANDLQFQSGTCGKGDPMQGAPVWHGAPHVRLKSIRIASR